MLLEVALVGKPLVVSDIPENTQVFLNDEVVYFKNKDVEDLAIKITYTLEHEEETLIMADKAKNKVLNNETSPIEYYMELHKMDINILTIASVLKE